MNVQPSSALKRDPLVTRLRGSAAKEIQVLNDTERSRGKPKFDETHDKTRVEDNAADDFDSTNWVASYPGANVEHIGNGSGGVRG